MEQDYQTLDLPEGSKILSVLEQNNTIVLYALVDIDIESTDVYNIAIKGTGHNFQKELEDYTFLGSVNLVGGALIFHVFYKKVE